MPPATLSAPNNKYGLGSGTASSNGISTNANGFVAPAPTYVQQQRTDANGNAYTVSLPSTVQNQSTTTLSNANKINQVPALVNNLSSVSNKGITTDGQGNQRYADQSFVQPSPYNDVRDSAGLLVNPPDAKFDRNTGQPINQNTSGTTSSGSSNNPQSSLTDLTSGITPTDTSAEDTQTQSLLDQMKSSLDSSTKSLIDNIQQKFALRKQEQQDINARQAKGVNNALLMGGATGQGSSAQYAPISSSGIVSAQENYGIKQIADLDAQENDLIAQAKAAQESGNFQIMQKQLALVDEKRQEKIAAATKLNDAIATQNAKMRESAIQGSRDSAIADLFSQGVTNTADILKTLNDQGGDFTSKEISDTLKNIVPPGLDDLVKTLRTNGAPSDVISKVLSSQDMSQAYQSAGSYASGGTGMIGEYNFYKAQAESKGQVPVDFNTYQNMDANRKAKVAAAGVANGLSGPTMTKVQQIAGQFDSEQTVKNYQVVAEGKAFLDSISNNTKNPSDQQGAIYAFAKIMDPNSVVREGEYATVQKYAQSWAKQFGGSVNQAINGTGFLSPDALKNMKLTVASRAAAAENSYKNIASEYGRRIDKVTGQKDGSEYITDYSKGYGATGGDLIQSEDQAEQKVTSVSKNNAKIASIIDPYIAKGTNFSDIIIMFPEYFK